MQTKRNFPVIAVAIALVVIQLACGVGGGSSAQPDNGSPRVVPSEAARPTRSPVQPTRSPVQPTRSPVQPTLPLNIPLPSAGTGNVAGRIMWNDQPVIGTEVKLCEDFGMFSGCEGVNYSADTDDNGYYLFVNVTPGEYALAAHAIDQDTWLYVTAGLGIGADKYTVTADQTLQIEDQSIYKFDLTQTSPADDARVSESQPMLTWDAYPGADYYEVYLTPENGEAIFVSDETSDTQIAPPEPLLGCQYTWQIEAFNARGIKIAEHDGYFHFAVIDQPVTCEVILVSPQEGAKVSGEGLLLTWESHPLAAYYRVHIWDADYNDLLDGARSNETSYTVTETLVPGEYRWYVTAYDNADHEVASSDFYDFTVTVP